jgi:exopolyphosphatase/guanosine-5'-triphosphate,3'-diphosphate pyrophosphatase
LTGSTPPVAIVDIGSNSIRLVVYAGAPRVPSIIFNEKVMAALGRCVATTGRLSDKAQARALAALARFRLLTEDMGVERTRVVATAAVREAANGREFLDKVCALGLDAEILSGEEEARMAGYGVLSAIPDADGLVADLGGGSLELVEVGGADIGRRASFPFGVLRIPAMLDKGKAAASKKFARAFEKSPVGEAGRGRPLYLVGGSWRALARLDMLLTDYPLPITHQYRMQPKRAEDLGKAIARLDKAEVESLPSLSVSRVPALPHADLLLKALVRSLGPSELVVSSFGIREGILYSQLDEATRRCDPLLEATREAGRGLSRFPGNGDRLDRWIAPLFSDPPPVARLRLAACLLADVAWQANPDFRAERGLDMALHGNWVGIDAPGRVMIAQALFCNFGGGSHFRDLEVSRLCTPAQLALASRWGLAMRLGQRLSGGVSTSLERSRLHLAEDEIRLELPEEQTALFGETVERRLKQLAAAFRLPARAVTA